MGEFSAKNLKCSGGVLGALMAACPFVAVPVALYTVIRSVYAESLTPQDAEALYAFFLYAVIFGAAVTAAAYVYGCYPRGTRSRLLFGVLSGALIAFYAFMVFVASGLTPVFADYGIPLDTKYFALMVAFVSVPLLFSAGAEYILSRKKWLESAGSAQAQAVGAR